MAYRPTRLYDIQSQQTVCTLAECVVGRWCYCDPSTKPDDWKGNTNDMATVYEPEPSDKPRVIVEETLYPCGCGWSRCDVHRPMMEDIWQAWHFPLTDSQWLAIEREADGFGAGAGSMGGDWSGIRDSTPDAVERMHAAAANFAKFVR